MSIANEIKIEINNSYSQVIGLTPQLFSGLRKVLSYQPNAHSAHFSGGFVRTNYLIDKKGFFPTGLLSKVKSHFIALGFTPQYLDKRTRPMPMQPHILLGATPYKWQLEAVEAAIKRGQGTISATTGSGKSLVIALLAARLNLRTLVVCPSLEIKAQLKEGLKGLKDVTVENIDSKALNTAKGYDVLIIDEAHHTASRTYQKLNAKAWTGIYYRFMLTATPFRNVEHEQLLFLGIAGQIVYKLDYKDAVSQNFIVPIEAYYIESPKIVASGYTWHQVYNEIVVNNEARNELISLLLLRLNSAGIATLCLVKEIEHGQNLANTTGLAFAHGQDEESRQYIRQFNDGGIKALIGTTGILGEGVDTRPTEYVIIAGLGKAKSAFMQQVGRCVRNYPGKESAKVILILDKSHKWSKAHFNAQKSILLDEYGVVPIKLEL